MATVTDKLEWILDFKSQNLSTLTKDLQSAQKAIKSFSDKTTNLIKIIPKIENINIKVNSTQAEGALYRLYTLAKLYNQEIGKAKSFTPRVNTSGIGRTPRIPTPTAPSRMPAMNSVANRTPRMPGSSMPSMASSVGGGGNFGNVAGSLGSGLATVAKTVAFGAVAAAGLAVYAFRNFMKESVAVIKEKEAIMRNYTIQLGSREAAEREYFKAAAFSQKTDLTFTQAADIQQRLINAGFRNTKDNKMLDKGLYAISDLSALQPHDRRQAFINNFTDAMTKTANAGHLERMSYKSLVRRGLSAGDFDESLRKSMGLGKKANIQKMISNGEIGANAAIEAIFDATLKKTKTDKLGDYSVGAAGTLGGLLSNLGEFKQNLIRSIDLQDLSGLKEFKDFLSGLMDDLNVFNGKAGNFRELIKTVLNGGFKLFTFIGKFLKSTVYSFMDNMGSALQRAGLSTAAFGESMRKLQDALLGAGVGLGKLAADALPYLIKGLSTVADVITGVVKGIEWFKQKLGSLPIKFFEIFTEISNLISDIFNKDPNKRPKSYIGKVVSNSGKIVEKHPGFLKGIGGAVPLFGMLYSGLVLNKASKDANIEQEAQKKAEERELRIKNIQDALNKVREDKANLLREAERARLEALGKQNNLIKDQVKMSDHLAKQAGITGKHFALFTPEALMLQTAHLINQIQEAKQAPEIVASGVRLPSATAAMPIATNRMSTNANVTLNFTINGDNKAEEIAQKVEVELTRIFGRITINPTPGVL